MKEKVCYDFRTHKQGVAVTVLGSLTTCAKESRHGKQTGQQSETDKMVEIEAKIAALLHILLNIGEPLAVTYVWCVSLFRCLCAYVSAFEPVCMCASSCSRSIQFKSHEIKKSIR